MYNTDLIEQAQNLYKSVNTFILSCVGADGYPLTKAVVPGKYRESIKEMYFCTNTSSNFTAAIALNDKAAVYFYSRKLIWKGCMLKGKMEIVDDIRVKERYWQNKFKKAYAEQSYTDADFCLIKFTPASGRFYSMFKPQNFDI